MIMLFMVIVSMAGPYPPHKNKHKLMPKEREEIELKCKKYGGESQAKCIELELKKLKDKGDKSLDMDGAS
jgi:hypothetical protein